MSTSHVKDRRISLDMVTVGDPGNENDPFTGNIFGAVDYKYQIGKYEVTIQQYTHFLNSVAASDPYELYNPSMASDQTIAGILQSGSPGSYTYSVIGPSGENPTGASSAGDRPITYVSWFDAARFANWMHNGQGSSGSTETGAYTLNGATKGNTTAVNPGAKFYIPSENEWYKAAFYAPTLNSGTGGYYLFATQNNSIPGNMISSLPNQANYYDGAFAVFPKISENQNYLTDVGAFTSSPSYYGTYDQDGNAYEWTDGAGVSAPEIALRGGYWTSNQADLSTLDRYVTVPGYEFNGNGFRLASPSAEL